MTTRAVRAATSSLAAILLLGGLPAVAAAGPGGDSPSSAGGAPSGVAATGPTAVGQVDAPVPQIAWGPCEGDGVEAFECASVEVPTDYDNPQGRTTTIGLTRLPATDADARIGSLFTNFGGPGGPGVETLHLLGGSLFDDDVLARFDVVGFDPRAVGTSDPATCFRDAERESAFLAGLPAFPVDDREEIRYLGQMAAFGASCTVFSGDRIAHSSTANVARDMDLLRQAVGDEQLSYVGYSYGTVLGATYAALFPDRVRAMVLDGTMDVDAWSGVGSRELVGARIGQAAGATETFDEFARLCGEAGQTGCALASLGDPAEVVEATYAALREAPVDVPMPDGTSVPIGYPDTVALVFQYLYEPVAWGDLDLTLASLAVLSGAVEPPPAPEQQPRATSTLPSLGELLRRAGFAEDYASVGGALASLCVDTTTPGRPWEYPAKVDALDAQYPHFGRFRGWVGVQCEFVPVEDRDAFTGPWDQTTDAPVLVVGTRFDPATPYGFTQPYADRWPDARVLTVEGWGHTIIGKSACADAAVARYLVDLDATDGATCAQDVVPFQGPSVPLGEAMRLPVT
ncbi:alpha/beta hydrolase [Cellulosimicrobium protaetiae]|uniref:Alpha/beta fold hydrolase n=1 Tax=Cellulosimicrobium protaetiae TaxID=2587808 RepID=A0A6M5UAY0_9MICO|nr:alpha/beta hydrolase [Cellulosimicrobium protaetiae]QJW35264.1 alpha/beta fold hydrolase [Cellulosimicrobium protaetiae]